MMGCGEPCVLAQAPVESSFPPPIQVSFGHDEHVRDSLAAMGSKGEELLRSSMNARYEK